MAVEVAAEEEFESERWAGETVPTVDVAEEIMLVTDACFERTAVSCFLSAGMTEMTEDAEDVDAKG